MISTPRSGETAKIIFGPKKIHVGGGGRKFALVGICILFQPMISYSTLRVYWERKKKCDERTDEQTDGRTE